MTKRIVLLQALASTPTDIKRLLKGIDESTARRRPADSEWSMVEIVNHLVDIEDRYRVRLKRVITEDNPYFDYMHPDEAAVDESISIQALVKQFELGRGETVGFLSAISQGDWARPAVHETLGETRFRFLVQNLLDHDIMHLSQIVDVRQQLRKDGAMAGAQPAVPLAQGYEARET